MPFRPFPDPPVPVGAVIADSIITVTFDQELLAGTLDHINWTVRYDGNLFAVSSAAADGFDVTLELGFGATNPGPPGVSYAATPADVIGVNGQPAEAFEDFPFA